MKPLIFALGLMFAFSGLRAQTPAWRPSRGSVQVSMRPGTVPDAQRVAGPELATIEIIPK